MKRLMDGTNELRGSFECASKNWGRPLLGVKGEGICSLRQIIYGVFDLREALVSNEPIKESGIYFAMEHFLHQINSVDEIWLKLNHVVNAVQTQKHTHSYERSIPCHGPFPPRCETPDWQFVSSQSVESLSFADRAYPPSPFNLVPYRFFCLV